MDHADRGKAHTEFLREFPRTGPGTAAGNMLRQYWHPVCLSEDLRDIPYAVRMLGEDLVAFRSGDGNVELLWAEASDGLQTNTASTKATFSPETGGFFMTRQGRCDWKTCCKVHSYLD